VLTVAAVAAHKGIAIDQIEATIDRRTEEERPWRTAFAIAVDLGGGLTRRERAILYNAARGCEVHKLLDGEIAFEYALVGGRH
jgi:uncharacterized OsmC-like protein